MTYEEYKLKDRSFIGRILNRDDYKLRFNYFVSKNGIHWRTTKLWWKPFYWIGSRNWFRNGIEKYISGREFWGGGGKINWWCRKHLTYD